MTKGGNGKVEYKPHKQAHRKSFSSSKFYEFVSYVFSLVENSKEKYNRAAFPPVLCVG
jgi:hypothetical protein